MKRAAEDCMAYTYTSGVVKMRGYPEVNLASEYILQAMNYNHELRPVESYDQTKTSCLVCTHIHGFVRRAGMRSRLATAACQCHT